MEKKSNKLVVDSVQKKHMNSFEYMVLHRRMYAIVKNDSWFIGLYYDGSSDQPVTIPVTRVAFDSFLSYEMDFRVMLSVFSSLMIKFAELPVPF